MGLKELNSWLAVLANLGVVAGIAFLAVEIRQNQMSIDESNLINLLDARRAELDSFNQFRAMVIQDDNPRIWLEGAEGKELTPTDQLIYSQLCTTSNWISATSYESSVALGRTEVAKGNVTRRAQSNQTYPGHRACWESVKPAIRGYGLGEYVDLVDALSRDENTIE